MRHFFVILSFVIASTVNVNAQTVVTKKTASKKALTMYKRGLQYVKGDLYDKALKDFNKALKLQPTFIDAMIQKGAIPYMQGKYEVAEQEFEKVIELDKAYNSKVFFSLANCEKAQSKYDEAIGHFNDYLNSAKTHPALVTKSKNHIQNLEFIRTAMKNPVKFDPKPVSSNINTRHPEYLPCVTADNNQLIYTKRIGGQEDLFISEKIGDEWGVGLPIEGVNNPVSNEGAQSVSADGKFIVFTQCETKKSIGSCDLFYAEVINGKWTKPKNMGEQINSKNWDSQPSISANGNILYFTSNRPGGKGGRDIWVSYRKKNGKWITPRNLGSTINSKGNEQSPFIHPDNQSLYFMSDALPGMGGDDIYISRKENNKWGEPKNLGYPINSTGNDGAMVISLDGNTGYFTTDRKYDPNKGESSFHDAMRGKETDIYQFDIDPSIKPKAVNYVKAIVTDIVTGATLESNLELSDLTTSKIFLYSKTDDHGEFLVCLPANNNYGLNVTREGYAFHSENFNLIENTDTNEPFILEIKLTPLSKDINSTTEATDVIKPIILKNVFFDSGSAELLPTSFIELDHLVDLLNENIALKIQINGHTDNVGSETDNLKLSDDRAESVKNYLIEHGILPVRLKHQGYGETVPVDSNDTDDGKQNNRRTEFMILQS